MTFTVNTDLSKQSLLENEKSVRAKEEGNGALCVPVAWKWERRLRRA